MRIVSSLHEIGLSEESISRSPTPSFAVGRALRLVPVAGDPRMAPEGMSFQLSYISSNIGPVNEGNY